MRIRKYSVSDGDAIENIHFETGFLGRSMQELLSNTALWSREIAYYLEKEPESIFVLESKGVVVGYLLGCLDDTKMNTAALFLTTRIKNFLQSIFLSRKDRVFWRSQFLVLLKIVFGFSGERRFNTPVNAGHFHINLLPQVRGRQYGTKLLHHFERYARTHGVSCIHADGYQTRVNPSMNFWLTNGFSEFSRVPTRTWERYLPEESISLVCYSKLL